MTDPLDEVEGRAGMRSMAALLRAFYGGLVEEGFSPSDAIRLTAAYVQGLGQGASR